MEHSYTQTFFAFTDGWTDRQVGRSIDIQPRPLSFCPGCPDSHSSRLGRTQAPGPCLDKIKMEQVQSEMATWPQMAHSCTTWQNQGQLQYLAKLQGVIAILTQNHKSIWPTNSQTGSLQYLAKQPPGYIQYVYTVYTYMKFIYCHYRIL